MFVCGSLITVRKLKGFLSSNPVNSSPILVAWSFDKLITSSLPHPKWKKLSVTFFFFSFLLGSSPMWSTISYPTSTSHIHIINLKPFYMASGLPLRITHTHTHQQMPIIQVGELYNSQSHRSIPLSIILLNLKFFTKSFPLSKTQVF